MRSLGDFRSKKALEYGLRAQLKKVYVPGWLKEKIQIASNVVFGLLTARDGCLSDRSEAQ